MRKIFKKHNIRCELKNMILFTASYICTFLPILYIIVFLYFYVGVRTHPRTCQDINTVPSAQRCYFFPL